MLSGMDAPEPPLVLIEYLAGQPYRVVHREFAPLDDALGRATDKANQADVSARFGATAFQIMPPGASQPSQAITMRQFSA